MSEAKDAESPLLPSCLLSVPPSPSSRAEPVRESSPKSMAAGHRRGTV